MRRKQVLYGSLILLECVLWGLGNPVIKTGGQFIGPFTLIALRFLVASCAFLLFAGRRVVRELKKTRLLPLLAVCVCTALAFTLGSFALLLTKATTAGFLMGIAVLFTPFLEPPLLGKRFSARILPVVLVVCVGMYLLCGGDGAFAFGAGELLAILCSLAFAVMLTLSEKYIGGMDAVALSAAQCFVATALCVPCALLFEGLPGPGLLEWQAIGSVLYLALGSTCLAYLLQNKAMRHIPATFASLAFCTEPIFTALFSYLLLGETLTAMSWVGAGIVLAGVMGASAMKT